MTTKREKKNALKRAREVLMVKLGKRTGNPQRGKGHRAGPSKKARGGSRDGSKPHRQEQLRIGPKGPSRTLAKEVNAKKKRDEERRRRRLQMINGGMPRRTDSQESQEAVDDEDISRSGSESESDGGNSEEEDGPQASYNRLMQVLKKQVVESDEESIAESDGNEEDGDEDEEIDEEENEEEVEWEEASSNDGENYEDMSASGDEDEDDQDDAKEELGESNRRVRAKKEREANPEGDRDHLGLDADAPESDDEEDEGEVEPAGRRGAKATAVTESKGGFAKYFEVTISAEQAEEAEKIRVGGKWKKQAALEEGMPDLLWRKGSIGASSCPAPVASDALLEDISATDKQVAQLFKRFVNGKNEKGRGASNVGGTLRSVVSGLSPLQRVLLPLLDTYMDLQFTGRRPGAVADELREVLALHVLNHIIKSRELIHKNNLRLKKNSEVEARDQGYTRGKVLVMLPCRNSAYRFIKTLLALSPNAQAPKGRVDNMSRFREEFGPGDQEDRRADRDLLLKVDQHHWERFEGNNEDHFRIGIQMHSKYARLFAPFYTADIIVASPLGLRMIVKSDTDKSRETDFLSSIELLVVDQLDYLLMQNPDHLYTVMDACNLSPFRSRGADFTRVREYFLDNLHKFARQTIVLSSIACPEANALLSRRSFNARGIVKTVEEHKGSLRLVLQQLHARHTFHRLADAATLAASEDARLEFFCNKIYQRLVSGLQTHTLLVVRSQIEFVRVRNFLKKQSASFLACSEYSDVSDVARARSEFFHGRKDMLLITERFHFYHRFKIRGIQHIVFYSLPQIPEFYSELVNLMSLFEDTGGSITAVYAKQDLLALQRVVGTARANHMLASQKASHMFA